MRATTERKQRGDLATRERKEHIEDKAMAHAKTAKDAKKFWLPNG